MRFYCPKCKRFVPRFAVKMEEYEMCYYCRWCGTPVLRVSLIVKRMIEMFIEYIFEKEDPEDYE